MTKKWFLLLNLFLIFAVSSGGCHRPGQPSENHPPKSVPPMKIEGAVEITNVKDAQDLALPPDQFKGINFVRSSDFFAKYPDRKNTPSGLYLLDTELIPKQLPEILARNNVALGPDGTLVNQKGEKALMVLGYKLAAVTQKPNAPPAAFPFRLEWVSFWYSWADNEGFCRSLTASTGADAWGPVITPWGQRVHTNIELIEAVAGAAGGPNDDHWCNNCGWEFAQANRDFGCWWPAHGNGVWGWVDFKDGSFHWSANW